MTQISRRPISQKLYQEIFKEFGWILSDIKEEKEMQLFLNDFLTSTEKIMLAKRFILATLILEGWEWYEICRFLHVSSATVAKMKNTLNEKGEGFREAYIRLKKKERWDSFMKSLDDLLPDIPTSHSEFIQASREQIHGKVPKGR